MRPNPICIIGGLFLGAATFALGLEMGRTQVETERAVFAPSFIYADLSEAREASTHYYCTDIIGVPDGYRLEVLPNKNCKR